MLVVGFAQSVPLPSRLARSDDRRHDGCSHVLPHVHLQQQQHALHHGHLAARAPTGLREGAHGGGQVDRKSTPLSTVFG